MKAITGDSILEFVGRSIGLPPEQFPDGGFIFGTPQDPVRGILVTWMATLASLKAAVSRNFNLVICHESFLFDELPQPPIYRWTSTPGEKPTQRDDHPNVVRQKFIQHHQLTLLHIHYGLDRLCIFDDFASEIGLGTCIAGGGYEKVYRLPQSFSVRDLARQVAERLNFPSVRIVGDPAKRVECVGNLWGGVGLSSNRYWMRRQIEFGAQAIVCGEADEVAMCFAVEHDVPLIVTGHAASENPGLRHFTQLLKREFTHVPSEIYEVSTPFVDLRDLA